MNTGSLYWTTITEYYDLEDGTEIKCRTKEETKKHIKQHYIIIKKIKNVKTTASTGNIRYTYTCRRKPKQGELNLS